VSRGAGADRDTEAAGTADAGAGWSRPTWAEVDLGALAANTRRLAARAPGAALMAVVKADAYGHGAVPVARAALAAGAAWLGVATLDEALELRRAGIGAPVLVLGWTPPELAGRAAWAGVDLTVSRLEEAAAMAARGSVRIHAKVDTGMGRLGFWAGPPAAPSEAGAAAPRDPEAAGAEAAAEAVARLAALPGVTLAGVYTHFAAADAPDLSHARMQLERFRAVLARLAARGVRVPLRHAANTAALVRLPESHFDMVRAGIGLYGYEPSPAVPPLGLEPVLTWKTRVVLVRRLPGGEGVSYGCTYVTPGPELLATLPVGYADGLSRSLSNRGEVLVRGRRAPIRGRVCMDQVVVSVQGVPGAREGDEVVLIGRQGTEAVTAAEVAERAGTVAYEILCAIGRRVPRTYRRGA
jgi:alanine racemase